VNRETSIWTFLFFAGGLFLTYQAIFSEKGVAQQYVVPIELAGRIDSVSNVVVPLKEEDEDAPGRILRGNRYDKGEKDQKNAVWSPSRTVGVWVAAFLTLCIFSYLYRDNVFYKLAESIIVGVSAGYWIVLNFWEVLVAKVLVKLAPDVARYAFLPDVPENAKPDYVYVIPVVLGCLVFCRWIPKLAWFGRWPLAFVVGMTAGLKLLLFLNADFVQQVRSTILPLIVYSATLSGTRAVDWQQSIQNIVIVVSVVSSLCYFYFSVEHKGLFGRISRFGIWVLMISFGASFALTVMGRITLLTMRLQFLFDDWLGLVRM